jgi:hypothetical protein
MEEGEAVVGGSSRSAYLWTAPGWQGESARRQGWLRRCVRPVNALSRELAERASVCAIRPGRPPFCEQYARGRTDELSAGVPKLRRLFFARPVHLP